MRGVSAKGSGKKQGDGSSVGLFIPLPVHLAKKFPTLIPDDHSPSHVTLLIIGKVKGEEEQKRLVEVLRAICGRYYWTEAKATLGKLETFDHGERIVPHVEVEFSKDFASFRRLIKQELEQQGFSPQDRHVEFRPHVTLDYLDPEEEWDSRIPKGTWTFDRIEVWGLPNCVPKIPLGKVKTAYGLKQGMSKLEELNHRMARLKRAVASREVARNLPESASVVWTQLEFLEEILKKQRSIPSEFNRDMLKIIMRAIALRETLQAKAAQVQEAKNQIWSEYRRDVRGFDGLIQQELKPLRDYIQSEDLSRINILLSRIQDEV